ncbi:putative MFS transporter [Paraburkholderia youngii]
MASPDHAGSVAPSGGTAAHSTDAARSAARSTAAQAAGHAALDAGSISARLDRLPATRSIWKLVVLLSLGFFFELYDLLYSGYVAPGLVKSGLLSATTRGLFGSTGVASFIAALFSGLFIGTIACGFLADRFGRRAVFTWSLLWYTAANVVMAFQETAAGLNFWRFIAGVGIGVELVTIGTYISELVPKQIRGRAFACEQAVGFTAVPVVAFLSFLLVPRTLFGLDGWRWVVLIGAHGALFVWWIRRALPESPRWLAQQGRLAEADRVMNALEAKVRHEYGRELPPPAPPVAVAPRGSFRDMWVPPYRSRTLMMTIFNVFQTVGFYGFANWVPTLLIKQGITITTSLMYSSVIALAAPIGSDHRALYRRSLRAQDGDRRDGRRQYRVRVVVQSSIGCGAAGELGGVPDTGRQHHFVQLSRVSDGTVSDQHPGARGRLRLLVEPLFRDFHGLSDRGRVALLRDDRRVRVHRGCDVDRDAGDRFDGTAYKRA